MSKKTKVMLRGNAPAEFRRTVRKDGKPVKDENGNDRVLTFQPGQAVELDADELEAVRDDIGNALFLTKDDDKGRSKIDGKATRQFVDETSKMRQKEAAQREAEKAEAAKNVTVTIPANQLQRAADAKADTGKAKK